MSAPSMWRNTRRSRRAIVRYRNRDSGSPTCSGAACEKKDRALLEAALKYNVAEIEAKTCKVRARAAKEFFFAKSGVNSWEHIDSGPFGGTVIMTIWRETDAGLWSYRETRAGDTNCKPGEPLCRRPGIVEYRRGELVSLGDCTYVEPG